MTQSKERGDDSVHGAATERSLERMSRSTPESLFAVPMVDIERCSDGAILLRTARALEPYPRCIGEHLEYWALHAPQRNFLLERSMSGTWEGVTYAQALRSVRRLAAGLLQRGLDASRPVVILSENSVEHALLMLAAMHVGIPYVSISSAYSLVSTDFVKLKRILSLVTPGLIYVADRARYSRALQAVRQVHDALVVVGESSQDIGDAVAFSSLEAEEGPEVEQAFRAVGPDTVAKLLFTSGSTDEPKGVINTQRMLTSNQQARAQLWPFLERTPPVIVDWLPWSHTFGANHNFNLVVRFGGTLYIDNGRPAPALFAKTVANLKEIAPTVYFNVPRGFDMLVDALRNDAQLRENFFSRLQVVFYAAAALPQHLWEALNALSIQTLGHPLPLVSAWGATETAPLVTDCHFQAQRSGVIGVPIPGCELKLTPSGDKLEVRVRGPNVTPGYWKRPDLTASHFDAEGFYKIGDAVRFVDERHPEYGLSFDGRVAEDFKLDSGTWVNVGLLRVKAVAALAPIAQDLVLTGHDRSEIGFLIFPNIAACREMCGALASDAPIAHVLAHPVIRERVTAGLAALRAEGGGSSTSAARALLLEEPPSIDAGEITDKGNINQRAVLNRRSELIARLYTQADDVIRPTR
jgi:feruloyl-CoA synthase